MFAHQYLARVMREPLTRQSAQGCKWETDHGFARFGGKRGVSTIGFKATSKSAEVTLDAPWQDGCKRQMEFYQWLLRRQGLPVAARGWFVYCNARRDLASFDARLEFKIKLIAYDGDDGWVEGALEAIHDALRAPGPPAVNDDCEYCRYAARWAGA